MTSEDRPPARRAAYRIVAAITTSQIPGFGLVRAIYEEAKDRVTQEHRDEVLRLKREKEIADRMLTLLLDEIEAQERTIAALTARLRERGPGD